MVHRAHRLERVGVVDPAWGPLRHVIASSDNRGFAVVTESEDGVQRYVFGGKVVAETGPHEPVPVSLSFDGTKLAVARRVVVDGGRVRHRIEINGEPAYEADLDTVHYLDWLSNDRLAWNGWNDDDTGRIDGGGIRRFVNGADVTDSLDYQPVLMDRMRHAIILTEGGVERTIFDDGSLSEPRQPRERFAFHEDGERPERPEEVWDGGRREVRVRYRGVAGPVFDGIETFGGMRSYAMNKDARRAAYVGIRYSGAARAMGRAVGAALHRLDGEPRGLSKLWAWPLALLFNPYMGIGHAYIEGSRRYFPVDHDRAWKKGYRFAGDHFYTPHDELVVTCAQGAGACVAIDEDEGPDFDAVENVRHLPGEDAVCYLARNGTDLIRVTVA